MKRLISVIIILSMLIGCCFTVRADEGNSLLANGGFETELSGKGDIWSFKNESNWFVGTSAGTGEITADEKHTGSSSLKIANATAGQCLTLEVGKSYRLSVYAKADFDTELPSIGFYDGTSDYPSSNPVKETKISVSTDWSEFTVDFDCPETKKYTVCLMKWDDDVNVFFDDVLLTETENDSRGVVNGNFSDGAEGWTLSDGAAVTDGALVISGENYDAEVSQRITGLENGRYNLNVTVTSSDIDGSAYVYARTAGHTMASTAIPQTDTPLRIVVPDAEVVDGVCDIGVRAKGSAVITLDDFFLSKTEERRLPFLKGGEISKLTYIENQGGHFYRADGSEADALQIMAENGFNLARIRVLNNPGKGHGDGYYYLPEGYMDEEDCLNLAKRAKDKGMQILFSFAYSDYWVDGEKQIIPSEWQEYIDENNLTGEAKYQYLETQVYEYTKKVLTDLKEQGTPPQYVAIGNEMQVGILFGVYGKNHDGSVYNKPAMYARFLNKGAAAVREVLPDAKIVLHSDHGGELISRRSGFMSLCKTVDFDVIGVSYYPFYIQYYSNKNTRTDDIITEFNTIANSYNKDVIVMETGYNWNATKPDGWAGQLADSNYYNNVYGETENGQRAFLTELYAKLKTSANGRCIGDLYWDPVMIYDGGADHSSGGGIGWAIQESDDWTQDNVVPNSTIFDFNGKAVSGQLAMKYNTNSSDKINITGKVKGGNTADGRFSVNVNGISYITDADKFGDYIVSVPYPSDGRLVISSDSYEEKYEKEAPLDGVLLSGIDFSAQDGERHYLETLPKFKDKLYIEKTDSENGVTLTASLQDGSYKLTAVTAVYSSTGTLQSAVMSEFKNRGENIISADIQKPDGENYKIFIWNDKYEPVTEVITPRTEGENKIFK